MNISIGDSDLHATVKLVYSFICTHRPPAISQRGFSIHGLCLGKFVLDSEDLVSIGIGLISHGWLKQNNNNNNSRFGPFTRTAFFYFLRIVKSLLKYHPTLQANAQPDPDASLETL